MNIIIFITGLISRVESILEIMVLIFNLYFNLHEFILLSICEVDIIVIIYLLVKIYNCKNILNQR